MAIRSVRYAGSGADAHPQNAGTTPGPAQLLVDCELMADGDETTVVKAGHGYTFSPGDALYVIAGTDSLSQGIYEIVGAGPNTISISGSPGTTSVHDASVRINGLWNLEAAGSGWSRHGPNPGDEVRVYGEGMIEPPAGGWVIACSGTAGSPIRFVGADASFEPLEDGHLRIGGTEAGYDAINATGSNLLIDRFHADKSGASGVTSCIRTGAVSGHIEVRCCKCTGGDYGVYLRGAENYLFDSEVADCGVGAYLYNDAVAARNWVHDCETGFYVLYRAVVMWNRMCDCGKFIDCGQNTSGNRPVIVVGNSMHRETVGEVGLLFSGATYKLAPIVWNNLFSNIDGWGISATIDGHYIHAMCNGYYNCAGGGLDAGKFGGVLDDGAVVLDCAPFVDAVGGDFRLAIGSMAMGAGTPVGGDIGAVPAEACLLVAPGMNGGMQ